MPTLQELLRALDAEEQASLAARMRADVPASDFALTKPERGFFGYGTTGEEASNPYRGMGPLDWNIASIGPFEAKVGDFVPGLGSMAAMSSMLRPRETWQDYAVLPAELISMLTPGRIKSRTKMGAEATYDVPYSVNLPWSRKRSESDMQTFEVLENPTESDLIRMLAKERRARGSGVEDAIRILEDKEMDRILAWHAENALHDEVARHFGVHAPPGIGPIWAP